VAACPTFKEVRRRRRHRRHRHGCLPAAGAVASLLAPGAPRAPIHLSAAPVCLACLPLPPPPSSQRKHNPLRAPPAGRWRMTGRSSSRGATSTATTPSAWTCLCCSKHAAARGKAVGAEGGGRWRFCVPPQPATGSGPRLPPRPAPLHQCPPPTHRAHIATAAVAASLGWCPRRG
jgi:hypothetical protein